MVAPVVARRERLSLGDALHHFGVSRALDDSGLGAFSPGLGNDSTVEEIQWRPIRRTKEAAHTRPRSASDYTECSALSNDEPLRRVSATRSSPNVVVLRVDKVKTMGYLFITQCTRGFEPGELGQRSRAGLGLDRGRQECRSPDESLD